MSKEIGLQKGSDQKEIIERVGNIVTISRVVAKHIDVDALKKQINDFREANEELDRLEADLRPIPERLKPFVILPPRLDTAELEALLAEIETQ